MKPQPLSSEAAQDVVLIEIAHLAHRFAADIVARDIADDVAQDVILECLVKLRGGAWRIDAAALPGLIRHMVGKRAIDNLRRTQRREERNTEHVYDLSDGTHAWMSPEAALEERELAELHRETLASLPRQCRRIYIMVREDGISYDRVAARLGLTRSAVSWHIVAAQRRFRRRLLEHGIVAPEPYSGRSRRENAQPQGATADRACNASHASECRHRA